MPTELLVSQLAVDLDADDEGVRRACARALSIDMADIVSIDVRRRAIDARKKRVRFVLTAHVIVAEGVHVALGSRRGVDVQAWAPPPAPVEPVCRVRPSRPVVVIGAGPGGLFAAWQLARAGVPTVLLERGAPVHERARDVAAFFREGRLDPESNALFGEGGAGTFSDGKLYTRTKNPRIRRAWEILVDYGAPPDILVDAQPHIGTNKLRSLIPHMREDLARMGVEIRFHTRVDGFDVAGGTLEALRLSGGERLRTEAVVLATGHSARDTYHALAEAGVELEPRPFALGVRIEHPQSLIDRLQLGGAAGHPALGAAAYRLTHQADERAVYSFCMCPGGQIVASTHEPETVVTNGMSARGRSGHFANAGLVVNVTPADYAPDGASPTALHAIEYQRRWERAAYTVGGGGFRAPAQRAPDFLRGAASEGAMESSYLPGVSPAALDDCLPPFVAEAIRRALKAFDRRMPGFAGPEAVLVGVESRVSTPVRIPRRPDGQSNRVAGLLPVGEGAGYAGGITSAAVDGLRCAERLIEILNER